MSKRPFLPRFVSFLEPLSGTDRCLRAIAYGSKLSAYCLAWHLARRKKLLGVPADAKADVRVASLEYSVTALRTVSSRLGDARTIHRFFGLIPSWQDLLDAFEELAKNPSDPLVVIGFVQALSMVLYYPLENVSWLGYNNVVRGINADAFSLWSCRFWGVWIAATLLGDIYKLSKLRQKLPAATPEERRQLEAQQRTLLLRFVKNGADFPLVLHWSLEKGAGLNEGGVGALGLTSSIAGIVLNFPGQ